MDLTSRKISGSIACHIKVNFGTFFTFFFVYVLAKHQLVMLSREEKLSAGHTAKPLPGLNAMFQHPTEVVAESDGGRR